MLEGYASKAILTKARAMYGKRLKAQDYQELLRKQTVSEIASYLKGQTHYAEVLENVQEATIHRGQLEDLLRMDLFSRYTRLMHYRFSRTAGFYKFLVYQAEVEQLLTSIRLLNAGESDQYIMALPTYLLQYTSYDLMELARVKSFEDLMAVLQKTGYAAILRKLRPAPGEKLNILAIEQGLLTFHYTRLLDFVGRQFQGNCARELSRLISIQIDLYNITALFRLKRFFSAKVPAEGTCLLGFPSQLRQSLLQRMMDARDAGEISRLVQQSFYGKYMGAEEADYMDDFTTRAKFGCNKAQMHYSGNAPVVITAFTLVSRVELENVINIIEGIRYNIPREDIEQLLIY